MAASTDNLSIVFWMVHTERNVQIEKKVLKIFIDGLHVGIFAYFIENMISLSDFYLIAFTARLKIHSHSQIFSSAAVLHIAFFSCSWSCWLSLQSFFVRFWLVQSIIRQLTFLSVSILFQTILSNARLDRSKLDEKEHKVVKSPTAIAGRDQLNSAKFSSIQFSSTQQNSAQLSLTQFWSTKINSAQFSTI